MQSQTQVMYEAKAICASVHFRDAFFFSVSTCIQKTLSEKNRNKSNCTKLRWKAGWGHWTIRQRCIIFARFIPSPLLPHISGFFLHRWKSAVPRVAHLNADTCLCASATMIVAQSIFNVSRQVAQLLIKLWGKRGAWKASICVSTCLDFPQS